MRGSLIARDGDRQPGAVTQLRNGLNHALAERLLADDRRSAIVLQRTGKDLACARSAVIHEHSHFRVGEKPVVERFILVLNAVFVHNIHDGITLVQKLARDVNTTWKVPTWVISQINHKPLCACGLHLLQCCRHVGCCARGELPDVDETDEFTITRPFHDSVFDRSYLQRLPRHVNSSLSRAVPHTHRDPRSWYSADARGSVVRRQ
mmetsp:Transcript_11176/g.30050  ORF Transcript_11176/g.30050 Transcript_11176/m.30050 type:complete len:206 (+) Transcript_11176:378-995(+)